MKARSLLPALAFLAGPAMLAAQDYDPPARAGRVSSVAGTVAFQAAGDPDWSIAPLNYTVTSGDRVVTSRRSRAEIEVGPFDVRLADSTDLGVTYLTDDFAQLALSRGTIRVTVYRKAPADSLEVDTPNGAMIIRSTGRYRVDVTEGVSTIVTVEDGTAELSGPSLDYVVRRGQSVELTGSRAISAVMVQHPAMSDFDQWSADRDRRQQQSECSRYMSRDIPGCADLQDHGRWENHATYGYVWRPINVAAGWVPYRQGRWVWTGPWGWSWVEDSPWGFAPFHYGRWVVVSGVWVWAPGPVIRRPCYAPALVVFVGNSYSVRYHQAWFPLGWREPYFPRYRHSDRYLRAVNIANVRNIANVDAFVDPRRADRITYANRQAATVVNTADFGRRRVEHVANVSGDELNAPVIRDRWQGPRVATRPVNASPSNPAPVHASPSNPAVSVVPSNPTTVGRRPTTPSATTPSTTIPSTTIPSATIPSTTIPSATIPSTTTDRPRTQSGDSPETRPQPRQRTQIEPRSELPSQSDPGAQPTVRERPTGLIYRNQPPTIERRPMSGTEMRAGAGIGTRAGDPQSAQQPGERRPLPRSEYPAAAAPRSSGSPPVGTPRRDGVSPTRTSVPSAAAPRSSAPAPRSSAPAAAPRTSAPAPRSSAPAAAPRPASRRAGGGSTGSPR